MGRARALVLSLLLALGCASNPAPRGTLPTADQLARSPWGGYVLVRHRNGAQTRGELLAARDGVVHVKTGRGVRAIPVAEIETMRLAAYHTSELPLTAWGLGGAATTISHGWFLVFSLPAWILSTLITAGVESHQALVDFPDEPLPAFARFARYPQGMPPPPPPPPSPVPPVPPPAPAEALPPASP